MPLVIKKKCRIKKNRAYSILEIIVSWKMLGCQNLIQKGEKNETNTKKIENRCKKKFYQSQK
jgi:hypothetical protein